MSKVCKPHGIVISTVCILVLVQGDVHHTGKAGSHCGNFTGVADKSIEDETEHYGCVQCLYPQNCLTGNQCKAGTSGGTCEKCIKDFYRVGSVCVKCPSFPWSAVSFGVYFLLLVGAIFYHGLTNSVCTKLKLLSHFLQNVLLTLHIKIAWPDRLLEILSIVNFGKFNSDILNPGGLYHGVDCLCFKQSPALIGQFDVYSLYWLLNKDCLFSSWPSMSAYYLEWITSLCFAVVVLLLGKFLDASMKQLLSIKSSRNSENSVESAWQKRTAVRRLVVTVTVILYMPATLSCIRTYLCSDSIPKLLVLDHSTNVYLLDNEVSCDTFVFQTIHFFATVYLVFFGLLLPPMLIFFTLRQKKWNLLYSQWNLYGPVYEGYKEKYCYWEAFPLLRKMIGIIVTEAYPVSAFIQTVVQLGMSGCYLLALIVLRPYSIHVIADLFCFFISVVSNLAICLLQALGLSIILEQYQQSSDMAAAGCVCIVVVVWIVLMVAMICESETHIDLTHVDALEPSSSNRQSQPHRPKKRWFRKTKVEPDPAFLEKVQENKARIDF